MNTYSKCLRSTCMNGIRNLRTNATRNAGNGARRSVPLMVGLGGAGMASIAVGLAYAHHHRNGIFPSGAEMPLMVKPVHAATPIVPQANVFSQTKNHALYLWIHLAPEANPKQCAKIVANMERYVDQVCPPDLRDEEDEVWAGVGFGPNFYCQVTGKKPHKEYHYPHRKGPLGHMPSTGGDIFIHAKSNTVSKLFELAQVIHKSLPKGSIDKFSDTYSFVYQNGRDLSGFIDGTENRADEDERFEVAVDPKTGGSYCITQKWVHRMNVVGGEKDSTMEGWVGRARSDSTELRRKPATSHVARMTSGTAVEAKKPVEIVRQSMPYGSVGGEAGLFFIGFAADPYNFEYMLDRMIGADKEGLSDDIMRLSECIAGTYWYFPSLDEIKSLR